MKERLVHTAEWAGCIGLIYYTSQWAFSKQLKKEVRSLQNNQCAYCGTKAKLQVHHIKPQSHKGSDRMENAIGLCSSCHHKFDQLALNENIYYDDY